MKQRKLIGMAFCLGWSSIVAWGAGKITQVEFMGNEDPNQIVIHADQPMSFNKQENPQDKQIVLELKDAQLASEGLSRKLDTSSFEGPVSMISSYQVEGQNLVRVVVQLRMMAKTEVVQEGNVLKIKIPTKSDKAPSQPQTAAREPVAEEDQEETQTENTHLSEFLANRKTQSFQGKPITLQVRNADITDVFRLIAEASGFNIILSDDVKGTITLSMMNVPWDLVLDTVLRTRRLGAERNQNILRVTTLANLTAEKQEELRAKQAAAASAPRVTRLFPISYAKLEDLSSTLRRFASTSQGGTEATIQVDNRTNSIIVQDTADNVEKMRKLVELLDTQTPQVLIEAKVIEATEGFSKNLGGSLGIGPGSATVNPQTFISMSGANPTDALFGTPGVFSGGNAVATATRGAGTIGFGILRNATRLNALLNIGESENEVKVISSPKTVVLNKQQAAITAGTPVLIKTTSQTQNGPISTETVTTANLNLSVTPTVTNDGSVLMQLTLQRDVPFDLGTSGGVATRNLNTMVVVENGSTLVIGGIYTMTTQHKESGFPWLRKLPIIGALFGAESSNSDRSELFFFITPKIINEKEAGLTS